MITMNEEEYLEMDGGEAAYTRIDITRMNDTRMNDMSLASEQFVHDTSVGDILPPEPAPENDKEEASDKIFTNTMAGNTTEPTSSAD